MDYNICILFLEYNIHEEKMETGTGKKTELARRMIVRYIWDEHLLEGDKLPSCAALCNSLGLGTATVFTAIRQLCLAGILEARNKVGVFVRNPQTPGFSGYRVAHLIGRRNSSPYNAALALYLQTEFAANSCLDIIFPGIYKESAITSLEDGLNAHTGVRQCIKQNEFDGILVQVSLSKENMKYLEKKKIPVCFAGGFPLKKVPYQVGVSLDAIAETGGKRIMELGFRRPVFLCPAEGIASAERFLAFAKNGVVIPFHHNNDLIEEVLAMPSQKRPDAFLITDDLLAQNMYSSFILRTGMKYLPHPIILREKEIPLYLPVKADFLEYSLVDLAAKTVGLLKEAMQIPGLPSKEIAINPEPCFISGEIKR